MLDLGENYLQYQKFLHPKNKNSKIKEKLFKKTKEVFGSMELFKVKRNNVNKYEKISPNDKKIENEEHQNIINNNEIKLFNRGELYIPNLEIDEEDKINCLLI